MHHVILSSDFKPNVGGIANYLHGIADVLAEDDAVSVLAWGIEPSETFNPEYEVMYEDGRSRRLGERWGDDVPFVRRLNSAYHIFRQCNPARRSMEEVLGGIRDEPIRVYIGIWTGVAHWWCSRLRKLDVSYRLFAYGRELLRSLDPFRDRWRRIDFGTAEAVFACSAATGSLVKERVGVSNTVTVHPGVSPPDDMDAIKENAEELRNDLGIRRDDRVVVTVGRLVERKGVHRVLKVLASESVQDGGIHYLVAGAGPEAERLARMSVELDIDDRTHFLGYVSDATKWAIYNLGDVFVMPNSSMRGEDWEGFGIVFIEAAVMGLPVIAGKSGGAVEAIEDGVSGFLVDPGSHEQLRTSMLRLLNDRPLSDAMGERARQRAREEFSWKKAAQLVRSNG